jgi:hypothetical protein
MSKVNPDHQRERTRVILEALERLQAETQSHREATMHAEERIAILQEQLDRQRAE